MELWLPGHLALDHETNDLIEDVVEAARRVDSHRPLPDDVVRRIHDELLGERVYSSNAIEGNTLELRETKMILQRGIEGVKKKREAQEALNLGEAVRRVTDWIDGDDGMHTVDRFLEAHRTILSGINDDWSGRFRDERVMIEAATHQPPDHAVVPALVERVLGYLVEASEATPDDGERGFNEAIVRAAWTHWAIARIHPFFDGNGRMARLWQDVVLLEAHLTCGIIRPEDRREYLESLATADGGDFNPLVQLVAGRVAATLDKYIAELGRTAAFEERLAEIVGEVDERAAEKARLSYNRWRRKMEQIRGEFEFCAAKVSSASKAVRVQVERYPMIDQSQWQNLRDGIGAAKTWLLRIDFVSTNKRLRYFFFFGKHFWSVLDDDRDRSEQRTALLISEDSGDGKAERLDKLDACPITIREIFVVDDRFVCRRVDPETGEVRYDRDRSAQDIAMDFIQEIVLKRLT